MLTTNKEIKNNLVESYWVKKYSSGIICLCVNTVNKWIYYHRYNNNEYLFSESSVDEANVEEYTLKIPIEELAIPSRHLCTDCQEKDQISFYYIPYELLDFTKKVIPNIMHESLDKVNEYNSE